MLNGSAGIPNTITNTSVFNQQRGGYYLDHFELNIVRQTVFFLWNQHRWGYLMERFIVGLLDGDAFDTLDAPFGDTFGLNAFIRIIQNLQTRFQDCVLLSHSTSVLCLAKSIYFWFMEQDETRSVLEMHKFSDFVRRTGISVHEIDDELFGSQPNLVNHSADSMSRYLATFTNVTG